MWTPLLYTAFGTMIGTNISSVFNTVRTLIVDRRVTKGRIKYIILDMAITAVLFYLFFITLVKPYSVKRAQTDAIKEEEVRRWRKDMLQAVRGF